jgi:CRISPR-associated protein Cas1
MAACVASRVRLASLRASGKVRFAVGGGQSGNVQLRLAQYRAAEDPGRSLDLARWLVAGKLQNARRMLQRWSWDARPRERRRLERLQDAIAKRIARLPLATSGDSVRGFEGEGSRLYFQGLRTHLTSTRCGLAFEARSRRPPRDPVNAALSFAYGLLLSEVTGALEAVGLDPQVGFLHGVRSGRPSLGLDLLEELRPVFADRFVVALLTRRMLTADDFTETPGGACYLSDVARRKFLDAYEEFKSEPVLHPLLEREVPRGGVPVVQAILLARHLRGDLPAYPPFVSTG